MPDEWEAIEDEYAAAYARVVELYAALEAVAAAADSFLTKAGSIEALASMLKELKRA